MLVRKGRVLDAAAIHALVNSLSSDGTLLPRGYEEVCEKVRDFYVAEDEYGNFLGCGALQIYGPHLAEIRSIVVKPEAQHCGVGHALLLALVAEADEHGIPAVCCFTRVPQFFARHGFVIADRELIPEKIRKDCQACARLYACDEVAMVRGVLAEPANEDSISHLVQLTY
jgi:amino-acid N-acetyltransferase